MEIATLPKVRDFSVPMRDPAFTVVFLTCVLSVLGDLPSPSYRIHVVPNLLGISELMFLQFGAANWWSIMYKQLRFYNSIAVCSCSHSCKLV
jgi:hypothetical protein